MEARLNKAVDQLKNSIINATQRIIQIKSVQDEGRPGMPFGQGINDVLNLILEIADSLGFKTKNLDGYAGYAEIGAGDGLIGILCHLDVVPEGSDWTYSPYGGEIDNNRIYGRGAVDNKGPAVAALYALKAIKDTGIKLNNRVRVIFGTNEESGWQGMDYYKEHEESPELAFSPDAEYPVIFAEKGILTFDLKKDFTQIESGNNQIKSINGGNAPNMVPDFCQAIVETNNHLKLMELVENFQARTGYNLELVQDSEQSIIKSYGISAHGSTPAEGQNAISQLMEFLGLVNLPDDDFKDFINLYNEYMGMETDGKSLNCNLTDDVSGDLTFNIGMIKLDSNSGEITINIRYPVTYDKEVVYDQIQETLTNKGVELIEKHYMAPLYIEKDDPLVSKLMKVYQEITGDKSEPIAMGGGTYARAFAKAVAFGPLFPGQPEVAHQKDEYIEIDDLIKNTKIYARAIIELAGSN